MVIVDVDATWPSEAGVGCGRDLIDVACGSFPGVTVDYTNPGEYRGSLKFAVIRGSWQCYVTSNSMPLARMNGRCRGGYEEAARAKSTLDFDDEVTS